MTRNIGAYNSKNVYEGIEYAGVVLDFASFPSGPRAGRGTSRTLDVRPGFFDSSFVNAPCPVLVGPDLFVFYTGFDGTTRRIGYAILNPTTLAVTSRPTTPCLALGSSGAWDDQQHFRVRVQPNPSPSPAAGEEYVMVYAGMKASTSKYSVGLAFSSDCVTWTKHTGNPIIAPGGSGAWDELYAVEPTNIVKDGSTYRLWYTGYDNTGSAWAQGGMVTASSIKGTWTKYAGNPVLARNGAGNQALAASVSAGASSVTVSTGSAYADGDVCVLASTTTGEVVRVSGTPSGNVVSFTGALVNSYTTSARLLKLGAGKISPSFVRWDDTRSVWVMSSTDYAYASAPLLEFTGPWTSSDLVTWTRDWTHSPQLDYRPETAGLIDRTSQENFAFIAVPTAEGFGNTTSAAYGDATAEAAAGSLLVLPESSAWEQVGTSIFVRTVNEPSTVQATVSGTAGGLLRYRGTDAALFDMSLDGTTWASAVTVPAGTSTVYLRVTPAAAGTTLSAEIGVPV